MNKILVSVPNNIAQKLRATIPQRQRSKIIVQLIEKEIERREKALYNCAVSVEQDEALTEKMKEWDITLQEGFSHESKLADKFSLKS